MSFRIFWLSILSYDSICRKLFWGVNPVELKRHTYMSKHTLLHMRLVDRVTLRMSLSLSLPHSVKYSVFQTVGVWKLSENDVTLMI